MSLGDQIWREDIIDQGDYMKDQVKVLNDLVQRASYQGAPPALVARLTRLRDQSASLYDDLMDLLPCFPMEPK